jgi:hypothetical protein
MVGSEIAGASVVSFCPIAERQAQIGQLLQHCFCR